MADFARLVVTTKGGPSDGAVSCRLAAPSRDRVRQLGLRPSRHILQVRHVHCNGRVPVYCRITAIPTGLIRGFDGARVASSFCHALRGGTGLCPNRTIR